MHIFIKLHNYSSFKTEIPSVSQGRKPRSNCRSSADGCRMWSNKPLHTAHELSVAPVTKSGKKPLAAALAQRQLITVQSVSIGNPFKY